MTETPLALDYERLFYIRTRGPEDKRPMDKWGGYGQSFAEADKVYTHEEVKMMPEEHWAVVGVEDEENMPKTTLVFDLDVHKAPDNFDVGKLDVAGDTLLVKSQSGGFHLYFTVQGHHQDYSESDFQMTRDLGWDIDIRGSAVGQHVVAPTDIPGIDTPYEVVQDEPIKNVLNPADAAERIRYDGEPLLTYSPTHTTPGDFDIDREVEPPEEMPTCYHRGLQLREASPEDHPNSHKVNVLTALCGLYAGYDVESVAQHFMDYSPDSPDQQTTEYQVQHIAEKIDRDQYSPPAITTLRNYGILEEDETCDCDIPYHGGDDTDENGAEQVWQWWSDARINGQFGEDAIVPDAALWHIADEKTSYPIEALPAAHDELPDVAARKALGWLDTVWAAGVNIDTDSENVTARQPPSVTGDSVHTWEGVRYVYRESKQDGRYAAVQLLRQEHEFLTPEDTEELHVYNPEIGIYEHGAIYDIGRKLDRELASHYSTHEKNEIISRLKERTVERDELEAGRFDGTYVCLENGVLDIDNRELVDHDPKWLFIRNLPVSYDPDADCPEIRDFLRDITRRQEDWKTMVEMLGNSLLPHYKYESFMVLFGRGANGKSTWFNVIRDFLGHDNIENIPLQDLSDNRFAAAQLLGQWANIGGDLPQKKIHDMGTLKDLTGDGEFWAEKKGKDGFNFENRAKMMFAANEPPVLGERGHAVARRILPIRLPNRYTPDPDDGHKDRDDEILDRMTKDEELSGLLNMALDGIERLRTKDDFSLPESPEERLEYYEQFSDHIKMFGVNCLQNESGRQERKSDVYNAYTRFCDEKGREPVAKQTFWTQLRKTTLDISITRPQRADGQRPRVADNLTFTDHGKQFAPNYETPDYDVPTISALAPGDEGVSVEGRVDEVDTDQPDQIAEKALLVDETDGITITIWDDSNKPALEAGGAYRFKNVDVTTYDGQREIQVGQNSGIEELSPGVGNVPSEDPGDNKQLDTAADGGKQQENKPAEGESEPTQFEPEAVHYVRTKENDLPNGVPHDMLFGHLVSEGASPDKAEHTIEKVLQRGDIREPETGLYRVK